MRDVLSRIEVGNKYGIMRSFSTDLESKILRMAFNQGFVSKGLDLEAPILMTNSFKDLISLRKSEWHHFESYRQALRKATEEKY